MTTRQTTTYAANYRLQAYWTRQTNTDGTGFNTCKECHKTESLWNHATTDHKEGEQLEDRRSVGASSCNCGDGTDQRVRSLIFTVVMTNDQQTKWQPLFPQQNQQRQWCYNYISTHSSSEVRLVAICLDHLQAVAEQW